MQQNLATHLVVVMKLWFPVQASSSNWIRIVYQLHNGERDNFCIPFFLRIVIIFRLLQVFELTEKSKPLSLASSFLNDAHLHYREIQCFFSNVVFILWKSWSYNVDCHPKHSCIAFFVMSSFWDVSCYKWIFQLVELLAHAWGTWRWPSPRIFLILDDPSKEMNTEPKKSHWSAVSEEPSCCVITANE